MVDTWRYPSTCTAMSHRIRQRDHHQSRWRGTGEALFDLETGRQVLLATMHLNSDPMTCEEDNLIITSER
jgi:hypothetical protein